jgi:hypothetical protein
MAAISERRLLFLDNMAAISERRLFLLFLDNMATIWKNVQMPSSQKPKIVAILSKKSRNNRRPEKTAILSKKGNRRSEIAAILGKKSNRRSKIAAIFRQYGSYFGKTIALFRQYGSNFVFLLFLDNMAAILERRWFLLFLDNMAAILERRMKSETQNSCHIVQKEQKQSSS